MYGTQRHHLLVRAEVVNYLLTHEDDYKAYFEDAEWNHYVESMAGPKTWGDEITLRVAAEAFAIRIHVVSSVEENWLLDYSPSSRIVAGAREIFLTYVAPIHYNTIAPKR